ncbi:hypothetical protein I6J18_05185 [Peribacillus psychrosaccharolyticus]|uniref:Uncharacterized protein n=1 Tax=Peribacillus psychrosaccharolyticus TaxID=1407 RepID=A0A974NP59_PERPY|nr:hypothetical protein [Peribacillus psychrosaccharolyticus]MEC2054084.1 hypothetical protein [Peribacillus psychrosaccharolyticus]MED3742296.1 hypothetical protein [Peribacillus psychrosaccharolyticus]QQT01274.1 hypothetical protein I6J18_05185 [Peribacillus psychrosaccharolyticus]
MNKYDVEFTCGQIKFVHDFFKEYEDEKVVTTSKRLGKIKVIVQVGTALSADDTVKHLLNVFKESKYGPALYFIASVC